MTEEDICMKIHSAEGHRLLAACDKDLLGRELKDGDIRLQVSESFYFDEYADKEMFQRFLKTVDMANLVGEIVVSAALEAGVVNEEFVLRVEGIPHAQLCSM